MKPNEQAYWKALERRDASARGGFCYAVKTTGVYCRPGCPSRTPLRKNVEFFTDPAAARLRGYRPCKRCQPDTAVSADRDRDWIAGICNYIANHLDDSLTLEILGEAAGMSPFHLQRKFKALTGISPRAYISQQRLEAFKNGARRGESVAGALYGAGFGASSRLYTEANGRLGMTPAEYRKGAAGLRIRYATADSALGQVLLAATEKGLCAVRFANTVEDLRSEFPGAEFVRDDRSLDAWKEALVEHIAGEKFLPFLPLDVQATAFQRRVWDHLRLIPPGETQTYSEVAAAIGQPTAARAVARACAQNPVALAVPCHRVVSAYGKKLGYRWGSERKAALLKTESARAAASSDR